jgi:hypothetical protein
VDVSGAAKWVRGFEATGSSVRFQAEAGHRYLVVSPEGVLSPRIARVVVSTLREADNQADYLVIGPGEFLGAAEPLLERRRSQGLLSRAVSFEEIASEFAHGQPSAEAIQAFLSYAYHSWERPSPRYVLLLGDATDDPRHYQSTSWASPLPALWAKTSYLWTVSDPGFAAVNGEDLLPDLAIGRLPATTREQAETLVSKLLAWEDSGQGLSGNAVLVADTPDQGGDFEADVEDIRASFLPGRTTTTLKVSELGVATRPAILDSFDEGASLMSYVGHGGTAVWSSANVLSSWDTASLRAQSRQPLLLTMNCLNGYFVAPNFDALSEALLKAEGRGVVAAFSPSGLSLDGPAHQYHRAVMAEITSGAHERLGDALFAAQAAYAQIGLMLELLGVYQFSVTRLPRSNKRDDARPARDDPDPTRTDSTRVGDARGTRGLSCWCNLPCWEPGRAGGSGDAEGRAVGDRDLPAATISTSVTWPLPWIRPIIPRIRRRRGREPAAGGAGRPALERHHGRLLPARGGGARR